MPLDYQSDTGPKLACRFSMGEYQGKPSFLLHSPGKGFYWKNIPPDLEALIAMPNMEHSCKNFSLGPNGLFWYTYRSVKDVYEQKASSTPNLWSTLNEDWKDGCPIRLALGPSGFWWGEKEWIDKQSPAKGHLVQAFGVQPQTLVTESKKRYPGIRSFEINFVTIGVKGAWVMGTTTADPCWNGITEQLEKTLKREMAAGHRVKNVVLCSARHDIYWIEYMDDTVDYFLPVDWDINKIATYVKTHVNTPEDIWKPWDVPKPSVTGRTQLSPVRVDSDAWKFVDKLFRDGWRHPHKQNPAPKIQLIFEVVWSVSLHTTFFSYLDRIEQKGKFTVRQQIKGNQAYGWHGTRRRCLIGDSATNLTGFCADPGCATCVILLKSFDANFAGKAPGRAFLRFGRAIYTSTVSSKADDYQSSPSNSQYKSLILARTVKGTPEARKVGDKKLLAPGAGYDCVEGQVGQELNYDECCFYHNDAVRPAFLVLYK